MEYDIDSLVRNLDFNKNHLVDCGNGLFLTNYEISILEKYGIHYSQYNNLKSIILKIEEILNEDSCLDDLEQISKSMAERDYYLNTKK